MRNVSVQVLNLFEFSNLKNEEKGKHDEILEDLFVTHPQLIFSLLYFFRMSINTDGDLRKNIVYFYVSLLTFQSKEYMVQN